ncbi:MULTISPECIES: autotransporter assembly complex family protein [unclassified Sphingomonas]|uniref:autotransporter assembly complex protein TamA n=2 Tax=Bacteria TaxID=2 RepID=UPI000E100E8F|nr:MULTISPECIES: BamA/TamA family outer membrane protein [unclassified Sphingomonas]AXJ96156.1 outer membrane protein assembly factor [Sphingomonas sp. FARSPH]
MTARVGWFGLSATAAVLLCDPAMAQTVAPARPAPTTPASATPFPGADGTAIPLDPNAPLASMPDIGVDWPDLATAPGAPSGRAPGTASAAASDAGAERRYGWRIDGIDAVATPLLRRRFDQLSSLSANDGAPANAAQLDRRAREDADLLTTLLRGEGYYDARVATRVEPGDKPQVILAAEPGTLYRFSAVTVPGLAGAGDQTDALRQALGIKPDDPVSADAVVAGQARLRTDLWRQGFPFADVRPPELVVDHATRTATLDLAVSTGTERRFGRIVALPGNRVFGADHVAEIARFTPRQRYDVASLDDLKRALIQTGLVSSVEVKPIDSSDPGVVDVGVKLEPAPPRTIAGELGYGTGEGARAEISWTNRNLFPPEGGLTLRSVLGTQEQLGSIVFRRNNFEGRDRVLTAELAAAHTVRDAYDAKTFSLSASLERQTNIFFQKAWTWSFGAELLASDERDVIAATGAPRRRTFFISALPTSLNYDGSDDLLNPTRGFRLGGRVSPELSLQGAVFGYTRIQLDGSAYHPIRDGVVLAGRVRFGSILGAPRDQIAPSRRFYAGGGASVRGYGYQAIGPRDVNNDPIGGRSLAEFSIETRVKVKGNFGIVPFLDGGNIYTSTLPGLSRFQYGTGVGLRYYSNFGPIRLDVGTPLNPQKGDSRVAVYVSLGQAF